MVGEEAVDAWIAPPFERVDFEMGLQLNPEFGPEVAAATGELVASEAWAEDILCPFAEGGIDGWLLS